jgi:hypothetical protein
LLCQAGLSWGEPWDLSVSVQVPPGAGSNGLRFQGLGIGGGIEILSGPNAGRLVVQGEAEKCFADPTGKCNLTALKQQTTKGPAPFAGESPGGYAEINYVLYSDDAGKVRVCLRALPDYVVTSIALPSLASAVAITRTCVPHSRSLAQTWAASRVFGAYGVEGEVAELWDPPGRLMYNMRVDGPMVPHCPGGTPTCTGVNLSPVFLNGNNLTAIACGSPTNPASDGVAPHHCRASMVSDTAGTSWTNNAGERSLFGDGIADLPDVGQDGGFCRGPKGWMVMANAMDNRDPGEEQQPRFNLTVSMSSDVRAISCNLLFVCGSDRS